MQKSPALILLLRWPSIRRGPAQSNEGVDPSYDSGAIGMSVAVARRDYYEVLAVERDATPEQLKKAYRRLAHKYHPDRNAETDAELMFKEASEAYQILSDPALRQRYDQFGHAGLNGAARTDYSHMRVDDIFSMFDDIFGGGFGRGASRSRGNDLQTEVTISLADVANGSEQQIEFERQDHCDGCGGTGAATGSERRTCRTCGGYGQVEQTGGLAGLFGRVVTTCPNCRGRGSSVVTPCNKCKGRGRVVGGRTLTVKIPAGIHEGQAVRIRGEGEPGENLADRGDLHVHVRVSPHPFLERHDSDLVCRMPISFTQAALGAVVEAPTLTGRAELKIPPGTQHGQLFRLGGQGLPDLRSGRKGDEIVQVLVEIPKSLSKAQETLLREFAKTEDLDVMPESRGFFDKLMDYLTPGDQK